MRGVDTPAIGAWMIGTWSASRARNCWDGFMFVLSKTDYSLY
jgi:hypothetical protein